MKITHYLYNTFIIEIGDKKIAIDPAALFFYYFRFTSMIPKSEWNDITHILVTHGDPDHYWHTDRVAKASNAPVICNETMVREIDGKRLALGPRSKGLTFDTVIDNLKTMAVGETIELDGMKISSFKTTHGPMTLKIGPFSKTVHPGPKERVGWGNIGYEIDVDGKKIVNLGDALLEEENWEHIKNPDVLMIPIGGGEIPNTMNEKEALQVVKHMKPKLVIPCHYNCPGLFSKNYTYTDAEWFKKEVEKMNIRCELMRKADSINI